MRLREVEQMFTPNYNVTLWDQPDWSSRWQQDASWCRKYQSQEWIRHTFQLGGQRSGQACRPGSGRWCRLHLMLLRMRWTIYYNLVSNATGAMVVFAFVLLFDRWRGRTSTYWQISAVNRNGEVSLLYYLQPFLRLFNSLILKSNFLKRHNLTETFVDNLSLGLAKSLEKLPGVQVWQSCNTETSVLAVCITVLLINRIRW